jgi:2-oxo-4-hydroxy-4-carboxy--5-ureidoimidazoline (OHCU) decarboxylase
MTHLPDIATVSSLDVEQRAQILNTLFEQCTQLHTLSVSLLHEQTFPSYNGLIDAVGKQLYDLQASNLESDQKWLDAILSAHPRLGEKKVDSEQSRKEQAQLNSGGEGEAKKLAELNQKYEKRFPGLRYVYASPAFEDQQRSSRC